MRCSFLNASKEDLGTITRLIITTLFAGSAFLISLPIQAEVLFDSTANPIFGLDPVSDGVKLNASFLTGDQPVRLSHLTLRWHRDLEQIAAIRILLLNDNSGRPGSLRDNLALVDSRALPTSEQWLSIRLTNEKTLTRQTRYWIQVTATGPAGSMAYSREHSGQGVATESYLNMYGFHRNTETGPYIFKLVALEKNP